MENNELTWKNVRQNLNITPDEEAEIQLEINLIEETIYTRKKNNISQRKLSQLSGIKQPTIARIESRSRSPQTSTLIKMLYPMGYTLKVTPLKNDSSKKDF